MKKRKLYGSLLMLFVTFLWGSAVVAQDEGMTHLGPFGFTALRCLLASVVLLCVFFIMRRLRQRKLASEADPEQKREVVLQSIKGGAITGCFLLVGLSLQQFGLLYTTVGKSSFISTLYVVFIPIFELFLGRKPKLKFCIAVLISVTGLFFMCVNEQLSLNTGDLLTLGSAFVVGFYILALDRYATVVNAFLYTGVMQGVCGSIALVLMFMFESVSLSAITASWLPLLYAGVLSGAGAYVFEVYAQRELPAGLAALFFAMEAIFASLSSWVVQGELFSSREMIGAALVIVAIVVATAPQRKREV